MDRSKQTQHCGTCGQWGGRLTHRCHEIAGDDWVDLFDLNQTVNVRCGNCDEFNNTPLLNVSLGGVCVKCKHCRSTTQGRLQRWPASRRPPVIPQPDIPPFRFVN